MTDDVIKNAEPAIKEMPVYKREHKPKKAAPLKITDWSWVVWFLGFFILPSVIRVITHLPVTWVVTSYWELDSLGGYTQAYANRMLGFADYYGRTTITYIMLIALLFLLIYLVLYKRIDIKRWGLSLGNILPGIVLFGMIWVTIYYLYIPYASAFSSANFYLGIPLPPQAPALIPYTTIGEVNEVFEMLFMPKNFPIYTLSANLASPFETNYLMGILDFFRVWFLNAPILFSLTWGFFFNSMKEKLGVWKDTATWKTYGKVISVFFLTVISIPIMQALYRFFDEMFSHQVDVGKMQNAQVADPKVSILSEPYFFLIALGIAILANMLAGSSFKGERVKDSISKPIKWAFFAVILIAFIVVLFTGEAYMAPASFTLVSGLLAVILVASISWIAFEPAEDSTLNGFSEYTKWLPGVVIVIISTLASLTFKTSGLESSFTIPLILTVSFWVAIALVSNYLFNWIFIEANHDSLSDWGKSLVKWLPGTIVFTVGIVLSFLNGWHVAPGIYGPFSGQFGLITVILLCGWVYIRTENLVASFLLYASLPWFLNFIQVKGYDSPTAAGAIGTGVLVLLAVLAVIESYRLWAHWITWDFELVKKELPAEAGNISESPATN